MAATDHDIRWERELVELRKSREEIESELARRHNWAEQEAFWRQQARLQGWIRLAAIIGASATLLAGIATAAAALAGILGWAPGAPAP